MSKRLDRLVEQVKFLEEGSGEGVLVMEPARPTVDSQTMQEIRRELYSMGLRPRHVRIEALRRVGLVRRPQDTHIHLCSPLSSFADGIQPTKFLNPTYLLRGGRCTPLHPPYGGDSLRLRAAKLLLLLPRVLGSRLTMVTRAIAASVTG